MEAGQGDHDNGAGSWSWSTCHCMTLGKATEAGLRNYLAELPLPMMSAQTLFHPCRMRCNYDLKSRNAYRQLPQETELNISASQLLPKALWSRDIFKDNIVSWISLLVAIDLITNVCHFSLLSPCFPSLLMSERSPCSVMLVFTPS